MTAAQLNAAAKTLYRHHRAYEGAGVGFPKWKNLSDHERELYRSVTRAMYHAAMSA